MHSGMRGCILACEVSSHTHFFNGFLQHVINNCSNVNNRNVTVLKKSVECSGKNSKKFLK